MRELGATVQLTPIKGYKPQNFNCTYMCNKGAIRAIGGTTWARMIIITETATVKKTQGIITIPTTVQESIQAIRG